MQKSKDSLNRVQSPELLIIMGPTASGKTKVAVNLAQRLKGEIISADSRQVYKRMDIGTGKDISEYHTSTGVIPYHLIDILEPGEKYNLHEFQKDFKRSFEHIKAKGNQPILCGGTGLYIESVLRSLQFSAVPVNESLREELDILGYEELLNIFTKEASFYDSMADLSSRKRLIRAIEIKNWLKLHADHLSELNSFKTFPYRIYCINPPVELRRMKIIKRLHQRIDEGMIEEVAALLDEGISHESLIYYGLEYKYITLYCLGELSKDSMISKLETEIHRYAKRQMTFFRHMEKIGIPIRWIDGTLDSSQISDLIMRDFRFEEI